jgi:hypothetical protein
MSAARPHVRCRTWTVTLDPRRLTGIPGVIEDFLGFADIAQRPNTPRGIVHWDGTKWRGITRAISRDVLPQRGAAETTNEEARASSASADAPVTANANANANAIEEHDPNEAVTRLAVVLRPSLVDGMSDPIVSEALAKDIAGVSPLSTEDATLTSLVAALAPLVEEDNPTLFADPFEEARRKRIEHEIEPTKVSARFEDADADYANASEQAVGNRPTAGELFGRPPEPLFNLQLGRGEGTRALSLDTVADSAEIPLSGPADLDDLLPPPPFAAAITARMDAQMPAPVMPAPAMPAPVTPAPVTPLGPIVEPDANYTRILGPFATPTNGVRTPFAMVAA